MSEQGAREAVLKWVERDPLSYAFLLDFYERGARICYEGSDGLILKNDALNIVFSAGTATDCPELRTAMLVLVSDDTVMKTLVAEKVYPDLMDCRQALYLKKEPLVLPESDFTLRPLTMADLPFLLENYHNPGAFEAHMRGRIEEGMLGGELDGELAGFAGVHQEGTVGLLEVVPRFRRRGLAEVMESAIINQQLERGRLPYCHVRLGNDASVALQTKLGLTFDERIFYWLG